MYDSPKFDDYKHLLRVWKANNVTKEDSLLARQKNLKETKLFLQKRVDEDFYPTINLNEWKNLVEKIYNEI